MVFFWAILRTATPNRTRLKTVPKPRPSEILLRCLLCVWVVALPILAAPAGSEPVAPPPAPSEESGSPCHGCPHRESHSSCAHDAPLPCRSQNTCPRGADSPGAALFLAPAPTSLPAPAVAGPVCCIDPDATDVAFAPPVPPPRMPASR